jgi:hypothetical protein
MATHVKTAILSFLILLVFTSCSNSEIVLPDPLITKSSERVEDAVMWQSVRRPEILEEFRTHIYGRMPLGQPNNLKFVIVEENVEAVDGQATCREVDIHFSGPEGDGKIRLVLFVPNNITEPVPVFLLILHRSPKKMDPAREYKTPFWPVEMIIERGYATATFHVSDLAEDDPDTWKEGVCSLFPEYSSENRGDRWGAIAVWAWGALRSMDYLISDQDIDPDRIAVIGHSRGGKSALWAGAEDERFSLVISNESGCTGAALARRREGEKVRTINRRFPHWFAPNYKIYNNREFALPVDQHMLIALMAPRRVYISSAENDGWADPEGEFLSSVYAEPVYKLFGLQGLGTSIMPETDQPVHNGHIAYHIREGRHDLKEQDWNYFMDYADCCW